MAQDDESRVKVLVYQNKKYYKLEYTNKKDKQVVIGIPKSGDRERDFRRLRYFINTAGLVPEFETKESATDWRLTEEERLLLSRLLFECICPKECDCEKPPPKNWDGKSGVWMVSDHCPEHNINPAPYPHCLAHDDD